MTKILDIFFVCLLDFWIPSFMKCQLVVYILSYCFLEILYIFWMLIFFIFVANIFFHSVDYLLNSFKGVFWWTEVKVVFCGLFKKNIFDFSIVKQILMFFAKSVSVLFLHLYLQFILNLFLCSMWVEVKIHLSIQLSNAPSTVFQTEWAPSKAQYMEHLEGLTHSSLPLPQSEPSPDAQTHNEHVNCPSPPNSRQWQALLINNCTFSSWATWT